MDPLDKMWSSFVAIGLMAVASLLISFARTRPPGLIRWLLSSLAILLFIPILLYAIVAIL
jgi:hypothetical protein